MLDMLIINNKAQDQVTAVMKSFSSDYSIKERSLAETTYEDFSQLQCIVLCFDAEELSFKETCNELKNFLKRNNINSNIPVIPVIHQAELENKEWLEADLSEFIKNYKSLNLLNKGLVWYKTESLNDFKNKMKDAEYSSGSSVPPMRVVHGDIDDEISGKGAGIAKVIVTALLIILGVILGPVAGGLIGGLALGGPITGLIGAAIGLVVGPLTGFLIAKAIYFKPSTPVAEKRSADLQQNRELDERNTLWEAVKENLVPGNSVSSSMVSLSRLSTSSTTEQSQEDSTTKTKSGLELNNSETATLPIRVLDTHDGYNVPLPSSPAL